MDKELHERISKEMYESIIAAEQVRRLRSTLDKAEETLYRIIADDRTPLRERKRAMRVLRDYHAAKKAE